MKNLFKIIKIIISFMCIVFCVFYGSEVKEGIYKGILLCAKAVIPSLYLSTLFSVYLSNNMLAYIKSKYRILTIIVLSAIGGFPTGAKIISDSIENKTIDKSTALTIFPLCIGAGPGFVIVYIGNTLLHSYKSGVLLLISNLFATAVLTVLMFFIKKPEIISEYYVVRKEFTLTDAVTESAKAIMTVCCWVIVFSGLEEIISGFEFKNLQKYIIYFSEITNGVSNCKNIYLIAFILSFAGFSVHAQIFSLAKEIKPNYLKFLSVRIFHGFLSAVILKAFAIIFRLSETAGTVFSYSSFSADIFVSICQILCVIILIYTFLEKNIEKYI